MLRSGGPKLGLQPGDSCGMSEPQTRAYTDLASLKTYAGFQQTGLVLLQRKGRLQKQQASFQAQLAASAGDKVHPTSHNAQ